MKCFLALSLALACAPSVLHAATYNVEKSKHATLVLSVVDTVNLNGIYAEVRVTNRSSSNDLFVRMDGTNPTVNGDETYVVPPGNTRIFNNPNAEATQVKLISGIAAAYSVESP